MLQAVPRAFVLLLGILGALVGVLASPIDPVDRRAASYHIAVADQNSKTVRVYPRTADKWNDDAVFWEFKADPAWYENQDWINLSDVKIRKTAKHGWIAMVTASEGKAGIINITEEKRRTNLDDVMWQATPSGNPHAIERIPHVGAIVVASSKSNKLTVYVPQDPDDVDDFGNIKTSPYDYTIEGAHGVLWDPRGSSDPSKGFLWAIGTKYLYKFEVTGRGKDTKLKQVDKIALPGSGARNGHDLQPDFTDPDVLLLTHTSAAYEFNTKTGKFKLLMDEPKLKSFVRHSSGEYIWIQGDSSDLGHYVTFNKDLGDNKSKESQGWKDAKFYKARIYSPDLE